MVLLKTLSPWIKLATLTPQIKMFLTYSTEEEALNRSEQEGVRLGLAFHKHGTGSRYATFPVETINGKFALSVDGFLLTDDEAESAVTSFEAKTIELPEGLV